MKIYNKRMLAILLVLLTVCLAYNLRKEFNAASKATSRRQTIPSSKSGEAPIIRRYKHNEAEHVVVKENPPSEPSENPSRFMDSVLNELAIKEKQLQEATKVNATLKAANLKMERYQDSLYTYRDKELDLVYDLKNNNLSLNYALTLSTAKYWKRKWLLGPRQYYIDIFSDDPRVTIESVRRFTVKGPKPHKLGLGLSAGYAWTSGKLQPYVGLGLNYNLIRF